ncbi:hypothetical protein, partial [Sulfitobacter sp. HI0040]|uniref:hypothetical protein n=1 Tax=Sulfitobacter sp. HI0040 TaxID=1822232 RepID=UPI001F32D03F
LMFATRPYRKFTDDHRAFDDVLRRLMKGADATKSATRSYTSPWDRTGFSASDGVFAPFASVVS